MPVSLAEAQLNAVDDVDVSVINEFRKKSVILDAITFDDVVNPAGGGGTLTYGYRRQITQATASTRAINSEYAPQNVTTARYTTDLAVMGGAFEVDRVTAGIGPSASSDVSINMANKIDATIAEFQDLIINGDTATDANGFDGLNKALAGSDTELNVGTTAKDWSSFSSGSEQVVIDTIDEFVRKLDGRPTLILGNERALARLAAAARRANMYNSNPVDSIIVKDGDPAVEREAFGNIMFADPGTKAGTNDPIIPVVTRSTKWIVTETGTSGTFRLVADGLATSALAYNAANADIKAALELLPTVGTATVTGTAGTSASITLDTAVHVALIDATNGPHTIAENTGTKLDNVTDLYAVRFELDGFKGLSMAGGQVVRQWLPDFSTAGAVKKGEVELGPVGCALMKTKSAAVLRNIKVA